MQPFYLSRKIKSFPFSLFRRNNDFDRMTISNGSASSYLPQAYQKQFLGVGCTSFALQQVVCHLYAKVKEYQFKPKKFATILQNYGNGITLPTTSIPTRKKRCLPITYQGVLAFVANLLVVILIFIFVCFNFGINTISMSFSFFPLKYCTL